MRSDIESPGSLTLVALGRRVRIDCGAAPELLPLFGAHFEAMVAPFAMEAADLDYSVVIQDAEPQYALLRNAEPTLTCGHPEELVDGLVQDVTVQMQHCRPDLFFLHSAAVEWQGKAFLLVAQSGAGKSTTTWALLHHGFRYLSDELAPVDLESLHVSPYAQALTLKQQPMPPYGVGPHAVYVAQKILLPVSTLPEQAISEPRLVRGVFLLDRREDVESPQLRRVDPPEAAARLYVNALNARAHPNWGLDAAARIAEEVPCFALSTADLAATCALVRSAAQSALI